MKVHDVPSKMEVHDLPSKMEVHDVPSQIENLSQKLQVGEITYYMYTI